jgi:UPF0716 family protein affecting phage T7 exclusion
MRQNDFHAPSAGLTPRWRRAGLILIGGWLVLEVALAQLLAARLGWGLTLTLQALKGGFALLLLGFFGLQALTRFARGETRGKLRTFRAAGFGLMSLILFALPGWLPTLLGLALFSPSLQHEILRRWRPHRRADRA